MMKNLLWSLERGRCLIPRFNSVTFLASVALVCTGTKQLMAGAVDVRAQVTW